MKLHYTGYVNVNPLKGPSMKGARLIRGRGSRRPQKFRTSIVFSRKFYCFNRTHGGGGPKSQLLPDVEGAWLQQIQEGSWSLARQDSRPTFMRQTSQSCCQKLYHTPTSIENSIVVFVSPKTRLTLTYTDPMPLSPFPATIPTLLPPTLCFTRHYVGCDGSGSWSWYARRVANAPLRDDWVLILFRSSTAYQKGQALLCLWPAVTRSAGR